MPDLNTLTNQFFDRREAMRPTAWTWLKHLALFFIAFLTVTVAGSIQPFGSIPIFPEVQDPQNWTEGFNLLISLPALYFRLIFNTITGLFTDFELLKNGVYFSIPLLAILTAHEAGHYVACRLYGVDATLPYFIPMPPILSPAGTLGAFIKIVSPMPSRRAVFDIGVAGPIAGFIALVPVLIFGLLTMVQVSPEKVETANADLYFADPLLTQLLAKFIGVNLDFGKFNPFLAAAWVGMLVTSLNLIPSGQLDGGHAVYSIFGSRIHFWTGRVAFGVMALLSVLGWFLYSSPSGLLFTILLAVMMRVRHPEPLIDAPLDSRRKIVAVLTLLIFILCFVPFPIQVR
ncbi:MAG: site-2 protease family protein [Pyrinomonadaceae bacterium]|nr:site-2 protease family protein [Pyrinomonadaceae bacterium]